MTPLVEAKPLLAAQVFLTPMLSPDNRLQNLSSASIMQSYQGIREGNLGMNVEYSAGFLDVSLDPSSPEKSIRSISPGG